MNQAELRLIFRCEAHGVADQIYAFRSQADSALHTSAIQMMRYRGIFRVCSGPNRAMSIMQNFSGRRPQQKTTEFSIAVRRHHDQIDAVLLSECRDLNANVAMLNNSVDLKRLRRDHA